MTFEYFLIAALTATLGFITWFALSTSLKLPQTFQIQFDYHRPYVRRILRRRFLAFFLYGILPYLLIFKWPGLEGVQSFADLGISFAWNTRVTLAVLILGALLVLMLRRSSSSNYNLSNYPEIRVTIWTKSIFFWSAFSWILYLIALELLFRGFLLQSLYMITGEKLYAVLISTGMYGMIQYFKRNQISTFSIPYGILIGYVTFWSGSILPAILLHITSSLALEWFTIAKHPEIIIKT